MSEDFPTALNQRHASSPTTTGQMMKREINVIDNYEIESEEMDKLSEK